MKKILLLLLSMFIIFYGCSVKKELVKAPIKTPVKKTDPVVELPKSGYWLDKETETVHRIVVENGAEKVVSIIKYKDGKILEVMKILSSENNKGKLHWIYFVPSTKYIVELNAISVNNNEITVEWKNRGAKGETGSGNDRLIKCDENGNNNIKLDENRVNNIIESQI